MCAHEKYIGKKYGRWTVLAFSHVASGGRQMYLSQCDCGTLRPVSLAAMKNGHAISCGCLQREKVTIHGGTKQRLFRIWDHIKYRCLCPTCDAYKNYGGRGITLCQEWLNYENFRNWAFSNGYADGLTIDRIDVNGNYCPENCRWVTNKEQQRNKRNNRMITFGGKTQCISAWCEELHMKKGLVSKRLDAGWSIERALLTPTQIKQKNKGEKDG